MNCLFIIPARGGSKGLPGKNIKELDGKPLIIYSLEFARLFTTDDNICVTTDSDEIAACVGRFDYSVPFMRPSSLATDKAGSHEVILHALSEYEKKGKRYDALVLLQPTSPFRLKSHLEEAMALYNDETDMVVSVKESDENPYYNLFEIGPNGYLLKSKPGDYNTRQVCPKVYAYNGSIYIINPLSIKTTPLHQFKKNRMYVMPEMYSVDIDTAMDWVVAESLTKKIKDA